MANNPQIPFQRGAVEPVACLKAGYELIKDQYWLFLGICAVGMLVGSAVPFGILMGPMMCGVYLTFFRKRRGEPIEFGTLFKGFDYFGQSVIATLIHVLPILVIVVPAYLLFYVGMFVSLSSAGNSKDPTAFFAFMGVFAIFWFVMIIVIVIISILFIFAYPLIVDRGLSGVDAVKLSIRAALANFWRLLGLAMLNMLMGMVGVLACYIGVIFVFPISYAAMAMAYERVFGLRQPGDVIMNLPPPPPTFT